ncbi:hypothetical protein [Curtobacterium sp. RRHDQ10]
MINTSVHAGLYLYDAIGNPVGLLTDTGTRTNGDAFVKFGLRWYLPTTGT